MRPGLLIVLAVLISFVSITQTWGKEEIREQELAEQTFDTSRRRRRPWTRFSNAITCASYSHWKINGDSCVCKQRLSDSRHAGHAFSADASDEVPAGKSGYGRTDTLRRLQNRYVRTQPCDSKCLRKGFVKTGKQTVTEDRMKGLISMHGNYVAHSTSHKTVQFVMSRKSLLDVADDTTPDRQANAARRQGVDSSLLRYAGLTLSSDTETGSVHDVGLPPSLSGIRAQALRVVPATLQQVGVIFNEFTIPMGAVFSPAGNFVVLVYRRISTFTVYTLPSEYKFGGPVVGIMSSSSNSTSIDPSLPAGSISLPFNSYINISLPIYSEPLNGDVLCAFFAVNGSMFLSDLASRPNNCLSSTLGDFALVVKSSATTSPTQSGSSPPTSGSSSGAGTQSASPPHAKSSVNKKLIVGATFLTIVGLAFLVAVAFISVKLTANVKRFLATRHYTGNDEALQDSLVGGNIAPSAPVMRTKPALEIDAARFSI